MFFLKKKKEGGFINPAYEKFDQIMGKLVFVMIVVLLVTFVVLALKDLNEGSM
jgi:hypothetical protein